MPNIALVGEGGQAVGDKPRRAIEASDIYHSVFVLVVTRGRKVVLSRLPRGRYSATAMTLCFKNEGAPEAAARALVSTGVSATLHHLGDQLYTTANGQRSYMSVFYGVGDVARAGESGAALDAAGVAAKLDACTPAMQAIWASYSGMLPV